MAAIQPAGAPSGDSKGTRKRPSKPVLALPKGLVDAGEKALDTAVREVFEETGVTAEVITKLGDIKYVYSRSWGDGQRVFKIVSFYLMRYVSGRINQIADLEDAPKLLAYTGEKQMAQRAIEHVIAHPEL